jgi:hypothetical protein
MEDDRQAGKLAKGAKGTGPVLRVENGPAIPALADQGIEKHVAAPKRTAAHRIPKPFANGLIAD